MQGFKHSVTSFVLVLLLGTIGAATAAAVPGSQTQARDLPLAAQQAMQMFDLQPPEAYRQADRISRSSQHYKVTFKNTVQGWRFDSIAVGASAGSKAPGQAAGSVKYVPKIPQAMQTADFQPVEWPGVKNAVGDGQARSIIHGKWWLEVGYRYTDHGWQNASYKIRSLESRQNHLRAAREPGQIHMDLRLGDKKVPPRPEDYPSPPAPANADDSSHGAISYRCPYPGTDYDVRAVYQWTPTLNVHHADANREDANREKQTSGHWNVTDYTITPHPASFCAG